MPPQTKPPIDGVRVSPHVDTHTANNLLQEEAEKLFRTRIAQVPDVQTLLTELEHQGSVAVPCVGGSPVLYDASAHALKEALRLVGEGTELETAERILESISPVHGVLEKARNLLRVFAEGKAYTTHTTVRACMDAIHTAYQAERSKMVSARTTYFDALYAQTQSSSFFERLAFGGAEKERVLDEAQKAYNTILDTIHTKGAPLLTEQVGEKLPEEDALLVQEAVSWYETLLAYEAKHAIQAVEEVAIVRTQKNTHHSFLEFLHAGYAWSAIPSSVRITLVPEDYRAVLSLQGKKETFSTEEVKPVSTKKEEEKQSPVVVSVVREKETIKTSPPSPAPLVPVPVLPDELPEVSSHRTTTATTKTFTDSEFALPAKIPEDTLRTKGVYKNEEETEPTPFAIVAQQKISHEEVPKKEVVQKEVVVPEIPILHPKEACVVVHHVFVEGESLFDAIASAIGALPICSTLDLETQTILVRTVRDYVSQEIVHHTKAGDEAWLRACGIRADTLEHILAGTTLHLEVPLSVFEIVPKETTTLENPLQQEIHKDTTSTPLSAEKKVEIRYAPRIDDFSLERVQAEIRAVPVYKEDGEGKDGATALQILFEKGVFTGTVLGARPHITSLWRVLQAVPLSEVLNDIPGISYVQDGERVRLSKDTEALVYTMLCEIQEHIPSAVGLVATMLEEKSTFGVLVSRVAHTLTKEQGLLEPFEEERLVSSPSPSVPPLVQEKVHDVEPSPQEVKKTSELEKSIPVTTIEHAVSIQKVPPLQVVLGIPAPDDVQVRFVVEWAPPSMLSPLSKEVVAWVQTELGERTSDIAKKTITHLLSQKENDSLRVLFLEKIQKAVLELEEVFVRSLKYRGEVETLLQGKEVSLPFPDTFETYTVEEALTALYQQVEYYAHRIETKATV